MAHVLEIGRGLERYRGKRVFLFGASISGRRIKRIFDTYEIEVEAIADNDEKKAGKSLCGADIITFTELKERIKDNTAYIIQISSIHDIEIAAQLDKIGANYVLYSECCRLIFGENGDETGSDMAYKKARLMDLYDTRKKEALCYYNAGKYENALLITYEAVRMMYNLNFFYVDDVLERLLEDCARKYIEFDCADLIKDSKVVAFYDGVGANLRGIANIYLDALIQKGYHVMYITKSGVQIPKIRKIIGQDSESKIFFVNHTSYKEEAESVLQIVKEYKAKAFFVYDYEVGMVGLLAAHVLRGSGVVSYRIVLGDHAFWIGARAVDYFIEFRDYGITISTQYRKIDSKKIIKLPYYPEINKDIEFQGYPFDVFKNAKIIFSGGSLYKTFGNENLYYEIVEEIIKKYEDVIFWYAGEGDTSEFKRLMDKYPGRVYLTAERKDLFQVMRRCYFYLSTYPITGGQMGQYAVVAGKIPVTLLWHEEGRLQIHHADLLQCEFRTKEEMLVQIDRLFKDEGYLHQIEKNTKNQFIDKQDFIEQLGLLVEYQKTDYPVSFEKIDDEMVERFSSVYLENY